MIGGSWFFGVLGPLVVEGDGRPVEVPAGLTRALLAVLLAADGPLSRDRLIDELWGEEPPATAVSMLHGYLSKVRGLVGDLLELGPAGYRLVREGVETDVERFDALLEVAREDPAAAAPALTRALGLFRGEPLCDVPCEGSVAEWRRTLEERRWQAILARFDAELKDGAGGELLSDLDRYARLEPLDERLIGQLMLALYRAGRQTDALEAYRRLRLRLAEELGLDPGPALQSLHQQILEQAASLDGDHAPGVGGRSDPAGGVAGLSERADRADRAEQSVLMLPSLASATIGREEALEDLVALLGRQEVRIVTLTGPGGIGKSRLALLAAHAFAGSRADGARWIELAAVTNTREVAPAILRGLGLKPAAGETGEQALCRQLSTREMLLVLDNFEQVIESAPLVAVLHRNCPELIVLVTSRERLDLTAEHCYAVSPLGLPDQDRILTVEDLEKTPSTAMFLAAARRRDHHFSLAPDDAAAVAQICTRLEGLPLALELAAARTGFIGLQELAEDLDSRLESLGTGLRDAPARHRTLEATIDWSFALLDPDLQAVFTRFAVFAGGATLDAAQAIIGARSEAFDALIAKNMLARRDHPLGGGRLVMLDTLRDYAQRRLVRDPGEAELRRRHLEYYLMIAETASAQFSSGSEARALAALDSEEENIQAAREWALEHDPNLCLRLNGLLGYYWNGRRDPRALGWYEASLRAAGDEAAVRDRARTEHLRSRHLAIEHRYEEASAAANVALALYREADDHAGIANALRSLADDAGRAGDLGQSRRYAQEAVGYARTCGDEIVLARALRTWAICAAGDDRAPLIEQASAVLTRIGDNVGLARLYMDCGYGALTEDRVAEANELRERAIASMTPGDTPYWLALLWTNVGLARLFAGKPDAARPAFADALRLNSTSRHWEDCGESFAGLAAIAAGDGDDEAAARLRGAARTAGYPLSELDRPIDERLARDYTAAAEERLGHAAWQREEAIGAAWTTAAATKYAIDWVAVRAPAPP